MIVDSVWFVLYLQKKRMPHIGTNPPQSNPPENPIVPEEKSREESAVAIYTETDKKYLNYLQLRLEKARRNNDQAFEEFNGKTRLQYYEENEKIANTKLEPKKNEDDVVISAGTVESKLDALLSNLNTMNLSIEVHGYSKDNERISSLGVALEDIIHDTEIRDGGDGAGDKEKKILRQRELLKQGTVFVQEEWLRKFERKKKLKEKYNGEFKDFAGFTESLDLVFEGPSRTLLYPLNVYLGDITEFFMEDQPFVFAVIRQDYEIAKTKFGKFENWKFVNKGGIKDVTKEQKTIYDNKWRLTDLESEQVEIVLYQDQPNDEFQIIINGVLMLPIGFPLSAVTPAGKYNIAKQVFRVINDKFAFGASFVSAGSIKEVSNLIDEMLKLFVLKTRKSITPAYVNTSNRVINKKVLSPGRISMGLDPGDLKPIEGNEVQGVMPGEINVLTKLEELVNKSTVSQQFAGQPGKSGTTATEVLELRERAKASLGLVVASASFLELKLGYLRLWNILQNWFEPIDEKVVEIEGARQLVNSFRKTSRETPIVGAGIGQRQVLVSDQDLPDVKKIRDMEIAEEKRTGKPNRKIFIDSRGIRTAKILWYLVATPQEDDSSSFQKLLFKELLNDMLTLLQLGSRPNIAAIEQEFSRVWGKNRNSLFEKANINRDAAGVSSAGVPASQNGQPGAQNVPAIKAQRANQPGAQKIPTLGGQGIG